MPPAVARALDDLWRTACLALASFVARFGSPVEARRSNLGREAQLGRAIAALRRVQKTLRLMFIVYARHFGRTMAAVAARLRRRGRRHPGARRENADDPSSWRAGFLTPPPLRAPFCGPPRPQPPHLAACAPHPMRTIARKMEAIGRVLADPMPHVRRLARLVRRSRLAVLSRAPKRPPPRARREGWAALQDARRLAAWALNPGNPQFCDSS